MLHEDIIKYNQDLSNTDKAIATCLAECIDKTLTASESKIWHAHPVWFINGNPIVGYHKLKDCMRLLFWSGQSFDEPELKPEGKFKAAERRYKNLEELNLNDVERWLIKAKSIQWDYKNIVKRNGGLLRLH
jgi:hypothetical protein